VSGPRPLLGVFGGTFDPIHMGHLAVARQAREQLDLDSVLLVPSFLPPHREAAAAAPEDRLAMVRLAVRDRAGLEAEDAEVRRGGVSYTVDTLRELGRMRPGSDLVLLLGDDAAREVGDWHDPDALPGLARLAVFNRTGSVPAAPALLPAGALRLEVDSPDISATAVRARLARGEDLDGIVPASVLEYIHERGLYLPADGGRGTALS
jgi:nicotinate-nucleotide adenylyltransferase